MTKRPAPLAVAMTVLPALLVLGVLSFAAPCSLHDDGTTSPCFPTSRVVLALALVALALALVRLLVPAASRRPVVVALDAFVALVALAAAVLPGTALPLCMMATMRCHTVMRPVVMVLGLALALVSMVDAVYHARVDEGASTR